MTDLTPEELAGLRERAERATPGPWAAYFGVHGDPHVVAVADFPKTRAIAVWKEPEDYGRADALHIAGLDPETVLRLVAMAERRARYREALEAVIRYAGNGGDDYLADHARAALAEPEEAQHGDD